MVRAAAVALSAGVGAWAMTGTAGALALPPAVPGTVLNTGSASLVPVANFPVVAKAAAKPTAVKAKPAARKAKKANRR